MEGDVVNGASQLKTNGGIYVDKMETFDLEADCKNGARRGMWRYFRLDFRWGH